MLISKRHVCLLIVVMTATAANLGCGTKSKYQRQRISSSLPNGKANPAAQGTPAAEGAGTNLLGGTKETPKPGADGIDSFTKSEKSSELLQKISDNEMQLLKIDALNLGSLAQGSYNLKSVITSYNYISGSDEFRAFQESRLNCDAQNIRLVGTSDALVAGAMADDEDQGRKIEVPTKFTVGDNPLVRTGTANAVVSNKVNVLNVVDLLEGEDASLAASVINIITTQVANNDVWTASDGNAKIEIKLGKLASGNVQITVTVLESTQDPMITRNLFLEYSTQECTPPWQ